MDRGRPVVVAGLGAHRRAHRRQRSRSPRSASSGAQGQELVGAALTDLAPAPARDRRRRSPRARAGTCSCYDVDGRIESFDLVSGMRTMLRREARVAAARPVRVRRGDSPTCEASPHTARRSRVGRLRPQRVSSDEAIYGTYPTARRDAGHEPGRFPAKGRINKPLWESPARGHPGFADDHRGRARTPCSSRGCASGRARRRPRPVLTPPRPPPSLPPHLFARAARSTLPEPVFEDRQEGAGVVDDGVRLGQRSTAYGPVATAATRTSSTRAQWMSRGVSPITTVRSRAQGGAKPGPRDRRQPAAVLVVGAEAALARLEEVPHAGARELGRATGSRLPVTNDSGTRPAAPTTPRAARPSPAPPSRSDPPDRAARIRRAHAPPRRRSTSRHAHGGEQIARDRAIRSPRVVDAVDAEQVHAVHRARRPAARARAPRRRAGAACRRCRTAAGARG